MKSFGGCRLLSVESSGENLRSAAKTQSLKWVWVPAKGESVTAPPNAPVRVQMRD